MPEALHQMNRVMESMVLHASRQYLWGYARYKTAAYRCVTHVTEYPMLTRVVLKCLELLGRLPLSWVRALGFVLGWFLYAIVASRRKVVWINLRLCFPHWNEQQLRQCATQTFVHFAQTWLDRGWLWHAPASVTRVAYSLGRGNRWSWMDRSLSCLFAPHFVALDAGWTALTQQIDRKFNTIYTDQANKDSDAWIFKGVVVMAHQACLVGPKVSNPSLPV